MKLKIIKVPAFAFQNLPYFPSLGLSTIYSYLREKGFDITQEDLNIINHPPEKMISKQKEREKYIKTFCDIERVNKYLKEDQDDELENITIKYLKGVKLDDIDILLISIFNYDFCSSTLALLIARYFKTNFNNRLVVMGGEDNQIPYIYENFELYSNLEVLDYYILGFGEESLCMLLEKIAGKTVSFEDIPGLCYRQNKEIKRNGFADQILTVPDFDGLPLDCYRWRPDKPLKRSFKRQFPNTDILILPFQIIYGCPNRCAFCGFSLCKKTYYFQPHEAVKSLIKLSEQYKTKYFFFVDNTFNISRNFTNSFCDEIIKNNLKIFWSDCASVRHIDSPEMLIKMRKAGACRLVFGLETASPRMLRHIDKTITPEQVSRVFKWSHEAGIWTGVEIIAGLPQEREEDLQKTVDFLTENMEYIDEFWLGKFYLIKNSYMGKYPQRYGITNIREKKDSLEELSITNKERHRYIFDEIDGLKWEDKTRQMDHSFNTINRLRRYNHREPLEVPGRLNMLFYLYTHLSDKSEIRYYYNQYRRQAYLQRLLSTRALPWKIRSNLQRGTLVSSLKKIACGLMQR